MMNDEIICINRLNDIIAIVYQNTGRIYFMNTILSEEVLPRIDLVKLKNNEVILSSCCIKNVNFKRYKVLITTKGGDVIEVNIKDQNVYFL